MAFPPGACTASLPETDHSEDNRNDPSASLCPQHGCTLDTKSTVKKEKVKKVKSNSDMQVQKCNLPRSIPN